MDLSDEHLKGLIGTPEFGSSLKIKVTVVHKGNPTESHSDHVQDIAND